MSQTNADYAPPASGPYVELRVGGVRAWVQYGVWHGEHEGLVPALIGIGRSALIPGWVPWHDRWLADYVAAELGGEITRLREPPLDDAPAGIIY